MDLYSPLKMSMILSEIKFWWRTSMKLSVFLKNQVVLIANLQ